MTSFMAVKATTQYLVAAMTIFAAIMEITSCMAAVETTP